jgi:hypothetical protein
MRNLRRRLRRVIDGPCRSLGKIMRGLATGNWEKADQKYR